MTIALGLVANDGIVLCADTQKTISRVPQVALFYLGVLTFRN